METPVHAPLKEKIHLEIAKLKTMNFKSKVEYIWEYYKLLLAGIVIFLIIVGSLINSIFINPRPQTILHISWNSGFVLHEQLDALSDELTARLVEKNKNEAVAASQSLTDTDDPSMNMAGQQRLVAMLAAGEIDIFILEQEQLVEYAVIGFIQPMESMLEEIRHTDPAVYNYVIEQSAYALVELEDGSTEERLMGINIKNSNLLTELDFYEYDLYFSLSTSSNRLENAKAALIAFFE